MKNIKNKFILGIVGAVSVLGLALTGSGVAQAYSTGIRQDCNWPNRATFDLAGDSYGYTYTWRAYNRNGVFLGSHVGGNWYTPWEDVFVNVSSNDPSFYIVRWCR